MKKVLATVAALGLVLGVSANALALDKPSRASEVESVTEPVISKATAPGVALWSVTGQWVLAGAYLSQGLGAPGAAAVNNASDSPDAFYIYSFKILPTLQINDKISVKGELRFADRDVFGISNRVYQDSEGRLGGRIIDAYTVYMEWVSPFGKTRFGRTPAGTWGSSKFNNSTRQGDRLMWWTNFMPENWGSLIFTEKLSETDAGGGVNISDQDQDAYYVDLSYKADVGKTVGALWIVRNAQKGTAGNNASGTDVWTSTNLWLNGKYQFDNIGFEWEADLGFGDAGPDLDRSSLAFMADLNMTSGDWKFGALMYYGSGDVDSSDGDSEAAFSNSAGVGRDYNPYQIMNGDYMNMWNADNPLSGNGINPALTVGTGNVGVISLGLYTGWKMSPKASFSAELGFFNALEEAQGQDDSLGVEVGMGFGYKLYDNLNYNAHFSYLWTGDFFAGDGGYNHDDYDETQNIYLFAHALSMSF